MKKFIFLFLVFITILVTKDACASHAAGGELTYEHISANTYRFTFKFFRDCTGISEPSSVPLCITNLCNNTLQYTATLSKLNGNIPGTNNSNGTPTSTGCPGFQTKCQSGSSTVPGYREWWYQGIYIMPSAGVNCDQWRFSTYISARNSSTNINGGNFYVEAYLNRRPFPGQPAINNNSPTFTLAPIPYYCANQPTTYSNGTVELDNDSLSYLSIVPMNQGGCSFINPTNCSYTNALFNPSTNPFNTNNTFSVNPINGAINFTPNLVQTPTISVRVNEYRNGVLIGYVMRDIQLVILNCNAPNPVYTLDTASLSGGGLSNGAITACTNQLLNFCFSISSASPSAIITVSDNHATQALGSSLTYSNLLTSNVNGCFSWTPTMNDTGVHNIIINATDSACAPPGVLINQVFTLTIIVKPSGNVAVSAVNPDCGINNGLIQANYPGTPTFVLMPSNTVNSTGLFSNLGPGSYIVSVQSNTCATSSTVSLMPPSPPIWTAVSFTHPTCSNSNAGVIQTQASGLTGIQYAILPSAVNNLTGTFSNLAANTYTIRATDSNNCYADTTVALVMPANPSIQVSSMQQPNCLNNNGQILLTGSTVNPPINYFLNPGAFSNANGVFNSLASGIYTIIGTDNAGCSDSINVLLQQPAKPTWTAISSTNINCYNANNGQIMVSALPSLPSTMLYTIQPGNTTNSNGMFTNLAAGVYTITATDTNFCDTVASLTITNPVLLKIDSVQSANIDCNGNANGAITVFANGGTGNLSYSLSPANLTSTTGQFFNLPPAVYTIVVTDANNCTQSSTVIISEPPVLQLAVTSSSIPTCVPGNDGFIQLVGSGGTPIYQYTLGSVNQLTGSFSNLGSGIYTASITDANACTATLSINIATPISPVIDSIQINPVACFGDATGSMIIAAMGSTTINSYALQPGAVINTTGAFTNLISALYTITITDASGCSVSTSVTIPQPPLLQWDTVLATYVSCFGGANGAIQVSSIGGTPAISYATNLSSIANTSGFFDSLTSQTYTVIATDANSCSISTTINIQEPTALTVSQPLTSDVSCHGGNDGAIGISASGAVPAYSFTLNPGAVINSNGQFAGLSQGLYSITVSDANNCTTTTTIEVKEPSLLQIISFVTKPSCAPGNDGSIAVSAQGGTVPYLYDAGSGNQISNVFTGLTANSYTVIVTDSLGCTDTAIALISANALPYFDSILFDEPTCYGDDNGSLNIFGNGGNGQLTYSLDGSPFTNVTSYLNLKAGNYVIVLRDSLNCMADTTFVLPTPLPINLDNLILTPINCTGATDGSVILNGSGGRGSYVYYLRPGIQFNRSGIFKNLSAGSYNLTIEDVAKCSFDTMINMFENNPMDIFITKRNLGCYGTGYEGEAEAIIKGGAPPYSYEWSTNPRQFSARASGLRFGYYSVNITDANGCIETDTVYIEPGLCCQEVFLPNAFSPNGDGQNDEFRMISSAGIDLIQFEIFNRWGQKVWQTYNYTAGWDGNYIGVPAPAGTYYYIYRYNCLTDGKEYIKKGDIILLR